MEETRTYQLYHKKTKIKKRTKIKARIETELSSDNCAHKCLTLSFYYRVIEAFSLAFKDVTKVLLLLCLNTNP